MALLTVELRTAQGKVLQRVFDEGAIGRLSPALDDPSTHCLRFIDPYGDTVFNPVQAAVSSGELQTIAETASVAGDRERIEAVIELADLCATGVHVHLWFIGD